MAKQKEGSLQERIQKLVTSKGGYIIKEWGNMTKPKGIPDLIFCYQGLYCAIEVKVDNNTTSRQQRIHLRNINRAKGITAVCWSIDDAKIFLECIDKSLLENNYTSQMKCKIEQLLIENKIELGVDE